MLDREAALGRTVRGAVVGGGLLGLEAAGALTALGAETTVVEFADWLMPLQVDQAGGGALRRIIEQLGVAVRTSTATSRLRRRARRQGRRACSSPTATKLDADVVVFATGVRPRDELAREAGLEVGERGGSRRRRGLPDQRRAESSRSARSRTSPDACGASWAPATRWPRSSPTGCSVATATFEGADLSTKLKLLGVDVASFGDAFAATTGSLEVVYADPVGRRLQEARHERRRADPARRHARRRRERVHQPAAHGRPRARQRPDRLAPARGHGAAVPARALPDDAKVCSCNNVTAGTIRCAVTEQGCTDLAGVKACTKAGTSCGSCVSLVKKLVETELAEAGIEVSNALCEHFALTRAQLFDIVRVSGISTFSELIEQHGTGRGCDICRPVVGLDPVVARQRPRARRRERRRCRTPTTTSWPTCRRTAPTRSSRASPAARSRPRG